MSCVLWKLEPEYVSYRCFPANALRRRERKSSFIRIARRLATPRHASSRCFATPSMPAARWTAQRDFPQVVEANKSAHVEDAKDRQFWLSVYPAKRRPCCRVARMTRGRAGMRRTHDVAPCTFHAVSPGHPWPGVCQAKCGRPGSSAARWWAGIPCGPPKCKHSARAVGRR